MSIKTETSEGWLSPYVTRAEDDNGTSGKGRGSTPEESHRNALMDLEQKLEEQRAREIR